jgi:pilus assembly protein CpaC
VAKENGGARILDTSSMSVRSGEMASFQSGGELAVPVAQAGGVVTVEYKEYGVFLKALPITEGSNISLKLEVEVSAPASTTTAGHINFSKSKVSTVQYCKSLDSIAIGGLISNRNSKTFDALPSNASGALVQLYSSEDFRNERSQFVVFVTPAILRKGAVEANQELKGLVETDFGSYRERVR